MRLCETYHFVRPLKQVAMFVLCSAAFLLIGCRPDTVCRQDLEVAMGVCVRWTESNEQGETTLQMQWDSVEVMGVGSDSVPYLNARNATCIWLPLRVDTGVSTYDLLWHEQNERIAIYHSNARQFVSNACGCIVFHTIDSVRFGGTVVDSVEILNSLVGNAKEESIVLIMK